MSFIKDKVALITGGASGIGFCYATELLRNGLKGVTIADIDSSQGLKAVEAITQEFGPNRAVFVKTDVTILKEVEAAFEKTIETFKNLDILINNAGVLGDSIWEKEIAININGTLHGCFLGLDRYLPKYKSGSEAVLVNISSIVGLQPAPMLPVYGATKYAIVGLGKCLGCPDHYDTTKVRVLTISPGITETPLMSSLEDKVLNERYRDVLIKRLSEEEPLPSQKPEDVSIGLIKIIEEGSHGSFWVIEAGEAYEIEIPDRSALQRK